MRLTPEKENEIRAVLKSFLKDQSFYREHMETLLAEIDALRAELADADRVNELVKARHKDVAQERDRLREALDDALNLLSREDSRIIRERYDALAATSQSEEKA